MFFPFLQKNFLGMDHRWYILSIIYKTCVKFEDEPSRILGNKEVREYNISISMLQKHILRRIFRVVDLILLSFYVLVLGIFQWSYKSQCKHLNFMFCITKYYLYEYQNNVDTFSNVIYQILKLASTEMVSPKSVSIRKRKKDNGSFRFLLTKRITTYCINHDK